MRSFLRFGIVATALLLANLAVAGPNLVGSWTGRMQVEAGSVPKGLTPPQQKQLEQFKNTVVSLVLKANKTFTVSVKDAAGKPHTAAGTWAVKGNQLTLTHKNPNGQPPKPQAFTIAPNGKAFWHDLPSNMSMKGKVVFTH